MSEISSGYDAYVPASASSAPNSASTIAVAPHTRAPSTSKYGTFITPWGGIERTRSSQATASGSSNRDTGSSINRSTSCAASVKAGRLHGDADDRLQQVAADNHGNCREAPEDFDLGRVDPDLFIGFAQRSVFYRLSWMVETSTR